MIKKWREDIMTFLAIVLVILSIIITSKICGVLFRNTIGTTSAYMGRALLIFMIVMGLLASLCRYIGLY